MNRIEGILTFCCFAILVSASDGDISRAYEQIRSDGQTPEWALKELDLDRADVSRFMLEKMNVLRKKGTGTPSIETIREMLNVGPGKVIEWLVDQHDRLSAIGRSNMAESIRPCIYTCKEPYQILAFLLNDKETIINRDAAARTPIFPYIHRRVCDYAYNSLMWRLEKADGIDLNDLHIDRNIRMIFSNSKIEDRDKAIAQFVTWWSKESEALLDKKASLSEKRPRLKEKMEALMKKAAEPKQNPNAPDSGAAPAVPLNQEGTR